MLVDGEVNFVGYFSIDSIPMVLWDCLDSLLKLSHCSILSCAGIGWFEE